VQKKVRNPEFFARINFDVGIKREARARIEKPNKQKAELPQQ